MTERLIIGMSGASGAPLTVELLRRLHSTYPQIETHLVVTRGGEMTLRQETDQTVENLKALADVYYDNDNIGAAIASGSFHTIGMVVVPCSMKTVAGIVSGYSDNLLLRAADVCMKERRKLVLVPREAPLSTLHLRNLYQASQLGAVILPPMQTYYDHPRTVEDMTGHTAGRILEQFGLGERNDGWKGMDM
ncbi:MAG: UbiX family flavin prenyltransferase [Lachnospiraceae bacterium]|nr:UbiX family flavin prenyltransferase [Lachnospiraceae bacterium]